LATLLKQERALLADRQSQPLAARRIEQFYGKAFADHLATLDDEALATEIERLYERIVESFPEVSQGKGTLGQTAERELFAIRHLTIGRPAPEIEGPDLDDRPLKLSDFRGKVVMLDFWGDW
jgi:hypothetical protein